MMFETDTPRKRKKASELAELLLMKKKFQAKCRFRAIVRLAWANRHWLYDDDANYRGIDNVKKRVGQAVRSKTKKQMLSTNDKKLLNKPAKDRTLQERNYLYKILGGLKCFKRYPVDVKKKLAALLYFKYYSPGRVIVRQHHEAHALYFIVTGEVVVSLTIWDELLQKHQSIDVGLMQPGDMFGEVSLLHNIPRTATCTTSGHCELLALMKEDFKNVLQDSLQKHWDEVKLAMSQFTYFDSFDEVAKREGCIVAKMKSFVAQETIMGDGVGVPNFVYFVLSGRCQMIESMEVKIIKSIKRTYYQLIDSYVPEIKASLDIDTKYFKTSKSQLNNTSKEVENEKKDNPTDDSLPKKLNTSKMVTKSMISVNKKSVSSLKTNALTGVNKYASNKSQSNLAETIQLSGNTDASLQALSFFSRTSSEDSLSPRSVSSKTHFVSSMEDIHTIFMQVCQFTAGATFGFGENMRDRRIVALTPVYCMLMPKVWLLQKNPANIWTRIQHYLEKKIPTKKQLFKEFVSGRRWLEYRESVVADVISRTSNVNHTTIHDVPYSIRMEEIADI